MVKWFAICIHAQFFFCVWVCVCAICVVSRCVLTVFTLYLYHIVIWNLHCSFQTNHIDVDFVLLPIRWRYDGLSAAFFFFLLLLHRRQYTYHMEFIWIFLSNCNTRYEWKLCDYRGSQSFSNHRNAIMPLYSMYIFIITLCIERANGQVARMPRRALRLICARLLRVRLNGICFGS